MGALIEMPEGTQPLLPVEYEVPLVPLLDKQDPRDRIAEEQRLDKPIHLWLAPDEVALEARGFDRFVAVAESRDNDVATLQAPDEPFDVKIGTCVGNRLWLRVGLV